MAIKCPQCGAEFDVTLFTFDRKIQCDCGAWVDLRELITNNNLTCHCPTGYTGKKGELWYVRLLPPLEPDHAVYWVAMTTPYVLLGASKADWVAYLKRAMVQSDGPNDATRLHYLLMLHEETARLTRWVS